MSGDWAGLDSVTWSPTGDQIAFRTNCHGSRDELRIFDVAKGSVTVLTDVKHTDFALIGFSAKGDRILYATRRNLWSVGVDGSDARLLVAGTVEGDWSR